MYFDMYFTSFKKIRGERIFVEKHVSGRNLPSTGYGDLVIFLEEVVNSEIRVTVIISSMRTGGSMKSHMICCVFSLTGLFLFRETSFQQVLLSSSGPKENIFTSNFVYPWGCIRKCFPKYFCLQYFSIFQISYTRLMLLSYIVTDC